MFPEERELMELWSVRGLAEVMRRWSPELTTDIARANFADDAKFVDAMAEGSRREGSQYGFVAVTGVTWVADDGGCQITLPSGHDAARIRRMIDARLRHGKHLLIHDTDPDQPLGVVLVPSEELDLEINGAEVVIHISPDAPQIMLLADQTATRHLWSFRR